MYRPTWEERRIHEDTESGVLMRQKWLIRLKEVTGRWRQNQKQVKQQTDVFDQILLTSYSFCQLVTCVRVRASEFPETDTVSIESIQ